MPKQKANQLKLYTEQESSAYENGEGDVIERICTAFHDVTGYRLTFDPQLETKPANRVSLPLPDGKRKTAPTLELATEPDRVTESDPFEACRTFAETLSDLVTKLHVTRTALREREGELAAAVPLVCDPEEDRHQVADRLEAVLGAGVQAVGGTAAALFLLDDFTQHLKLRAHWGLSDDRFAAPPRLLRAATADLEALVGHAVVLDKPTAFETWNAPESFGSAVCVPVSTATVPLGTLWLFDEAPRNYDDAEVGIIEVVAGRLAAELEREILLRSRVDHGLHDESLTQDWTKLAWPAVAAPPGWQISTVAGDDGPLPQGCFLYGREGTQFHTAFVAVHEQGLRGAMLTAGVIGATTAEQVQLPPTELAAHLDQVAAQVCFEQRPSSTWCCSLDSKTGVIEYCPSGLIEAFVIRPHAWEILGGMTPRLAGDGVTNYETCTTQLEPGDALMVIGGTRQDPHDRQGVDSEELVDGPHLAELILRHAHQTTEESARVLKALLSRHRHVWQTPPNVLLIQRDA